MQACKLFLNIINKNKVLLIIYFAIFMVITVILTSTNSIASNQIEKVNTYLVFENEVDTSFKEYLDDYINEVDIKNTTIDDALFWENINLYIYVPSDYKEKLFNNDDEIITIKSTPDSIYAYQVVTKINEYFNFARESVRLNLCTKDNALEYAKNNIKNASGNISIEFQNEGNAHLVTAYNIITYIVATLILSIIGIVTLDLRNSEITRRLNISPLKIKERNLALLLCYFIFSLLTVIFSTALLFIPLGGLAFNNIGYFFLNNIIYTFVIVCMSYFLSSLCKKASAFNCMSIIIPLAFAFLSGTFIPQKFMPEITKIIAHVIPTYYTISANIYINDCLSFSFLKYFKIIWPLLIFVVIFITGTILINKKQARDES